MSEKSKDDLFELMTKIYSELQNTNKKVEENSRLIEENTRLIEENGRHIVRLENEFHDGIGGLEDEMKAVHEKLTDHDKQFEIVNSKLDSINDDVNVLAGRTKRHCYEIGVLKLKKQI